MSIEQISVVQAGPEHAAAIVALFNRNYGGKYWNDDFLSPERLALKLGEKDSYAGFVAYIDSSPASTAKAVGFGGFTIAWPSDQLQVYFCNLLVDKDYRKRGVGSKIDEGRISLFEKIHDKVIAYGLVHDIKSPQTIPTKIKRGFAIWGVRLFYGNQEPGNVGAGHLILIGQTRGYGCQKSIPSVHKATQNLITSVDKNCGFTKPTELEFFGIPTYGSNPAHGQQYCFLKYDKNGQALDGFIKKMKSHSVPYNAIKISAQNPALTFADGLLIKNQYLPTAYLPYYSDGEDLLEYQYLPEADVSDFSPNKTDILHLMASNTK